MGGRPRPVSLIEKLTRKVWESRGGPAKKKESRLPNGFVADMRNGIERDHFETKKKKSQGPNPGEKRPRNGFGDRKRVFPKTGGKTGTEYQKLNRVTRPENSNLTQSHSRGLWKHHVLGGGRRTKMGEGESQGVDRVIQ